MDNCMQRLVNIKAVSYAVLKFVHLGTLFAKLYNIQYWEKEGSFKKVLCLYKKIWD